MASSVNPFIAYEEQALNDITLSRYTLAASLVVIFYDWLLTLGSEVKHIWPARPSVVKTIFLVNRYCSPVLLVWANYAWSGNATWFRPLSCKIFIVLDSSLIIAFFAALHYVVSLRAWALYGRSRVVGIFLWGGFTVYLLAAYAITIKGLVSIPLTLFPIVNICFGTLPVYLWAIWLPSIVFETLVFGLTLYKAVQIQNTGTRTTVLSTLFRDGFLYFLFISINSCVNLVFWAIAPATKVLLVKYISTAITITAGSHLILDLREVGHLSSQLSEVAMNSKGEPLSPGPSNAYAFQNFQLRRLSAAPRSPVFPDRTEKIRLVTPNVWGSQSQDNLHSYPPSPQSYYPTSPSAIRFAQNV